MRAFTAGVLAGLGIAVPVGAIAVLIVDLSIRRGFRPAVPAALGAASADLLYATTAALVGLAAARLLEPVADELRIVSVVVLFGLAGYRMWRLLADRDARADGTTHGSDGTNRPAPTDGALRTYAGFLGLTLLNPMTVTYFAALILGLQAGVAADAAGKALFVVGAFLASASWQLVLVAVGAFAHHRLPAGARVVTGIVGNLVIVGFAIRLALTG